MSKTIVVDYYLYAAMRGQHAELLHQNRHYAGVIANLQAELGKEQEERKVMRAALEAKIAERSGPGNHLEKCRVPGTFLRRIGSLWSCDCGQMYRLDWFFGYAGESKEWRKI